MFSYTSTISDHEHELKFVPRRWERPLFSRKETPENHLPHKNGMIFEPHVETGSITNQIGKPSYYINNHKPVENTINQNNTPTLNG